MKIVHRICCGIDVHKRSVAATIASTDADLVTTYTTRSFPTLGPGLAELRAWLAQNGCRDVCMESTGKYWIPVYNALEEDCEVVLTHPKYVRAIKGKKTDAKDSKWIADLFKHDLVRSSFIPPRDIRACRELSRYRFKLIGMRTAEKNRYQNSMTVSGIGLANVLSDPFGRTAQDIMAHILSPGAIDLEACAKMVRGRAKRNTRLILDSISGCEVPPDQAFKMREAGAHMGYLDAMIARTEAELAARLVPYETQIRLLTSIPGIDELAAALVICEIGVDMGVFEDADHLCSWGGLAPASNESAGKKKPARVSRAGVYLKPLLVQCASAAVKSKEDPYFAAKFERIKRRRGHKKAIIAVARMMLVCIYHMLATGECFNPSDRDRPEAAEPRAPRITEEAAIGFLAGLGYDVTSLHKGATA